MYMIRHFYRGRPGYRCLQEAVRGHYLKHYGATPEPAPDLFLCLTEADGAAPGYACLGITYGDTGKLFSEYYLDQALDRTYGLERSRIVELGALASFRTGSGAGKYLLNAAIKTLMLHNYGLVVCTATGAVRQILDQIVTNLDDLGRAEHSRVRDPHVNWGTYYDQGPRVVASQLEPSAFWAHLPCGLIRSRHFAVPASV
ncbi:thermostable hemolysin [Pseudomonas sp. MWU16-30317]|uniref:thermostable hemolysin n=1 Tax=Pseudomonas sp. MWU16-30317 TaxID=2878095 RepID=UPI001CF9E435|nr:thermostable hemolysin [Pseudomonas sp. MWU16-30317]